MISVIEEVNTFTVGASDRRPGILSSGASASDRRHSEKAYENSDDGIDYSSESEDSDNLNTPRHHDSDLDEAQEYAQSDQDNTINDLDPNVASDQDDDTVNDVDNNDIIYNPQWQPRTAGLRDIPFTKENKILVPFPEDNTPFGWWEYLLDDAFLQTIVDKTNAYAWEAFPFRQFTTKF
ncbi:hypothetical protein J6590_009583 [Homalodisca vitripennis]|nr:hypothetical protein J6590_009583 [Homalodisca vitripennis]